MTTDYLRKRVQHYAIGVGFNILRIAGAFLIYLLIGLAQRQEPSILVLIVAYLILQAIAWAFKEVDMFRQANGQSRLHQLLFGVRVKGRA